MLRYNCRRYQDLAKQQRARRCCLALFMSLSNGLYSSCCSVTPAKLSGHIGIDVAKQPPPHPQPRPHPHRGPVAFSFDRATNWPVLHGTEADIRYQMEFKKWVSGLTARSVLKPGGENGENRWWCFKDRWMGSFWEHIADETLRITEHLQLWMNIQKAEGFVLKSKLRRARRWRDCRARLLNFA